MLRLKHTLKHSRQLLNLTTTGTHQTPFPANFTLSMQAYRSFALFKSKATSSRPNIDLHQPHFAAAGLGQQQQQRTQEDIAKSIENYKQNIQSKTQQGLTLSQQLAEAVEPDMFRKIQRYEIFINKMQQLYKSELRFQNRQRKKMQSQKNAILYSLTPLKDILRTYNDLTVRGFNSLATVQTLQNMLNTLRARGYQARVQNDYSRAELDQSWRMQKFVDDIKFGLRADQFFSPTHLAQTSYKLGELGYKNTQLIPLFFEKLNSQIDERILGNGARHEPTELSFKDAVYGDFKNFIPRHYVFKGFQNNDEFSEYLEILLDWETQSSLKDPSRMSLTQQQQQQVALDLERTMGNVINAAVQVKDLQKEFAASIENLRNQYFQMMQASDKFEFLQENKYIKYDLLELQELLVKGGFLDPDEANKTLAQEPFDQRMERAAEVFYDYVVNYSPELLSPQHNSFFEAAQRSLPQKQSNAKKMIKEQHNVINIGTLSEAIVGLAQQALSFRRDTVDKDYLNKFYEQYLMPAENFAYKDYFFEADRVKNENVMMERCYLKAWQIFKDQTQKLLPRFKEMVREDKANASGQLQALNALAAMRFDEPELRAEIVQNALKALAKESASLPSVHSVAGLRGLALSPSQDDNSKQLAAILAKKIEPNSLTFPQQIDTLWSLCALQQYETPLLKHLVNGINGFNFDRIDHDIQYEEFLKLLDINNALKIESPGKNQITNQGLLHGLNGHEHLLEQRYMENLTRYDPFKNRVLQALAKGLTDASIDHQVIQESELYQAQTLDQDVLNTDKYPYKPDVIMGYKGTKVGVFVYPEISTTRDTYQPSGAERFRHRLLEKSNQNISAASLAVNQVVNYDIEKLKIEINKDFNFHQSLQKQLKQEVQRQEPDLTLLGDFGGRLMKDAAVFIQSLPEERDVKKMDAFVRKLYQIFQVHHQNSLRFEPQQKNVGYDELRFQLMKLKLLFDSLNKDCQEFIQNKASQEHLNFSNIIERVFESIPEPVQTQISESAKDLNASWIGTRQEVELPVSKQDAATKITKNIVPEIINQRFMWVDDYFHYDDWKKKQQATFDNFNLIVVPLHKDAHKFFFDKDHHNRRIPQGIFPYPNHKRQIMLPAANTSVADLVRNPNHDDLVLFEKEPYKMMVINELKKTETLAPIDDETSMITNLQNIKQGLKSDYTDREILNIILLNMNFTEQLIDEHLEALQQAPKKGQKESSQPEFVSRDPTVFRRFVESTYHSKDREDPFTHFFLKEGAKKEEIYRLMEEEKELEKEYEENTKDNSVLEKGKERREKLQDKVDNILLQMEMQNEDMLDLSSALKSRVQVSYDMKTLVKSEYVYDIDPELVDKSLTDEQYLEIFRRRAEAKLIKTKIIYKLQQGQELSQKEKQYVKKWVAELQQENRTIFDLRNAMVPATHTKLTMGNIEAKSLYALNSISRVQFERDRHGKFSLNDLVVELSHFLDEEVVNKVETEIYSETVKQKWKLSKDFKLVDTRNKEISLVLNELEEVAWRTAGMLTEKDFDYLKRMISIKRNKDYFDKQFYENDMRSFKKFVEAANYYDDRVAMLEKWIVRKEEEFKTRVNLPPAHLKKTDQDLYAEIDRPLKQAREKIVSRLLIADEHGNTIEKQYKDLTSRELHTLTENLCLRLYLFNYEYPTFLPHVIKAVMEHPNLLKSDHDHIDIYCKMFEVDWRGDRSYENKQEFLYSNPVHLEGDNLKSYGDITNQVVKEKLQRACAPFLEETVAKILRHCSQ